MKKCHNELQLVSVRTHPMVAKFKIKLTHGNNYFSALLNLYHKTLICEKFLYMANNNCFNFLDALIICHVAF